MKPIDFSLFTETIIRLVPIYSMIALGYFSGKVLHVERIHVARIVLYILTPAVVFLGTFGIGDDSSVLFLPFYFVAAATGTWLIHKQFAGKFWNDGTERLLPVAMGTANTGYLGVPLGLLLFGEQALSAGVMCIMGMVFFDATVTFYVLARFRHSARDSFMKVIKLPNLYAFALALLFRHFSIGVNPMVESLLLQLKAAFFPLGMMCVGLCLSCANKSHMDKLFLLWGVLGKTATMILLIAGLLFLDQYVFHSLSELSRKVLMLQAILPVAANTVIYATECDCHSEKASILVTFSTAFSLILILFFPMYVH